MSTTATRTSPALRSRTVAIVAAWLATRLVMGAALLLAMRQSGLTPARALGNWDVQHYICLLYTSRCV